MKRSGAFVECVAWRCSAPLVLSILLSALIAHAQAVDVKLSKVTIAVDGMMKSKSGAT